MSTFQLGSTRFFGIYGASYEIITLTPKRLLKTCVLEKCYLSNEQILCRVFSLVIEQDVRQGKTYKGTEGIPTLIGQVVRYFCQKKEVYRFNFTRKKGYRPCERKVSPILSPSTDYGRHRVTFYAQQCFLAFGLCGNWYEICSLTPWRMLKTETFKGSYSSCEKEFWSFFL